MPVWGHRRPIRHLRAHPRHLRAPEAGVGTRGGGVGGRGFVPSLPHLTEALSPPPPPATRHSALRAHTPARAAPLLPPGGTPTPPNHIGHTHIGAPPRVCRSRSLLLFVGDNRRCIHACGL
jgi:hypothetical protein